MRRALKRLWYLFFRRHPYHYLGAALWVTLGGGERQRTRRVFERVARAPLGFRTRCLLVYLDNLYYSRHATSPSLPEPNRLRWSGPLAVAAHTEVAQKYAQRPELFECEFGPMLARVNELTRDNAYECVVELGCGAGLLIERMAAQAVDSSAAFVGLDLSPETIDLNRERYRGSRVQYHCCDNLQEFLGRTQAESVLVLAQGTLQFFTEAELLNCLRWLTGNIPRGALVVRDFTYPEASRQEHSRPGIGFTFFHNYETLFSQAGLREIQTEVETDRAQARTVLVSGIWGARP